MNEREEEATRRECGWEKETPSPQEEWNLQELRHIKEKRRKKFWWEKDCMEYDQDKI